MGTKLHTGQVEQACCVGLRRSDGIRQKSDNEAGVSHPERYGIQSRGDPSPDALWKFDPPGSAALCRL